MTFEWKPSTHEDFEEINKWHKYLLERFGNENAYTAYLTSEGVLLGDLVESVSENNPPLINTSTCHSAFLDGELNGFSLITLFQKGDEVIADIEVLAVKPTSQSKGVGTGMIFDLVKHREQILGLHIDSFTSQIHESNKASTRVFEKNGFENVGTKRGVKESFNLYKKLLDSVITEVVVPDHAQDSSTEIVK